MDLKHHSLCKFKKVCKFRCKLCDTVCLSRKAANDHHKQNHDKCICNICGKKCNTPSTLAHHKYSHQEEKKQVCRNCGEKFAFSGQLKQHRFTHHRISHFGCNKCPKRFKRKGELTIHLVKNENKVWSCAQCEYKTDDPCNLKQHMKLHSDHLPYQCDKCLKFFQFWMQQKRHTCDGLKVSSDTDTE